MSLLNVDTVEPEGVTTDLTLGAGGDKVVIPGTIKISGGSPGADKLLTSDADGDATWVAAGGGGLVALRIYTAASTTWSKSTNDPTKIIVEVIGGGGGSGAGTWTGGSGATSAYANVFLDVSTVDTATVTVGAAGAAGASGAGGTGGTSKFTYATGSGSFTEIECVGGGGGGYANSVGGAGAALPTGPANGVYIAGNGGGAAGHAGQVVHGYGASQGNDATTNYAVGYGAANSSTGSATTGRVGTQGLVLVWEYL